MRACRRGDVTSDDDRHGAKTTPPVPVASKGGADDTRRAPWAKGGAGGLGFIRCDYSPRSEDGSRPPAPVPIPLFFPSTHLPPMWRRRRFSLLGMGVCPPVRSPPATSSRRMACHGSYALMMMVGDASLRASGCGWSDFVGRRWSGACGMGVSPGSCCFQPSRRDTPDAWPYFVLPAVRAIVSRVGGRVAAAVCIGHRWKERSAVWVGAGKARTASAA